MVPNKKYRSRTIFKRRPMSRRVRRGIYFTLVLAWAIWALAGRLGYVPVSPSSDRQLYHNKSFTVIKVVDGDTIDLDVGDGATAYTRVRLWGVDTPETKHPRRGVMYYGPEAAQFTEKLVLHREVTVMLEPFERARDKYGRLLAYIYLPAGRAGVPDPNRRPDEIPNLDILSRNISSGKMLNEELVIQGYAYADEGFRHVLRGRFLSLQKQAQREKRGLWKNVQPAQWPEWYRKRHDPDFASGSGQG